MGVHQVGVGGAVLQGLEGVAHAARDVDGLARVEHGRVDLAEGLAALAQVHPCAEDRAARHRDELVPGLGVDAAGDAAAVVVGDVVLDDAEVGDAQGGHLGALPVLLEPAARVAVDGEADDLEALDAGLRHGEVLLECDVCHVSLPSYWPCARYLASVASLAGRHQGSLATYQSIVCFRPSAKSVCAGLQPSSRWSFVESMA